MKSTGFLTTCHDFRDIVRKITGVAKAMGDLDFQCDLCGRELEEEDVMGYLDVAGDDNSFVLTFHQRCAIRVSWAIGEARMAGAATLVRP